MPPAQPDPAPRLLHAAKAYWPGVVTGVVVVTVIVFWFLGRSMESPRQTINEWYSKDRSHVYYFQANTVDSPTILPGADPATFKPLGDDYQTYAVDVHHVYWEMNLLPDASVETFALKGGGYAKDATHVYYKGIELPGADPSTFEVVGGELTGVDPGAYAKDASHVYYDGEVIPGADPVTFTTEEDQYGDVYGKDWANTFSGVDIVTLPAFTTISQTIDIGHGQRRTLTFGTTTVEITDPSGRVPPQTLYPTDCSRYPDPGGDCPYSFDPIAYAGPTDINSDGYMDLLFNDFPENGGDAANYAVHPFIFNPKSDTFIPAPASLFPDAPNSGYYVLLMNPYFGPNGTLVEDEFNGGGAEGCASSDASFFVHGAYKLIYKNETDRPAPDSAHVRQIVSALQKDGTWKTPLDKTYVPGDCPADDTPHLDQALQAWSTASSTP